MKLSATTKTSDPKMMAWDTEFWGQRVGRATHLDGLGKWAKENQAQSVHLLIDADKPAEAQAAEERGFRFMDVRLTLERDTAPMGIKLPEATAEHADVLAEIARKAFPLTRFYADPSLDDERCGELYSEWTRSLLAGAADVVLVNAEPVSGYITISLEKPSSEIGLIAVAEEYRGLGVGATLVRAALGWAWSSGADTMSVVTQGRNIGALRTFEACRFRVTNTSLWFHKRYA